MLDEQVTLLTYLCLDNIWRTRCVEHVAQTGPHRPLLGAHSMQGTRAQCVACVFEQEKLVRLSSPLDEEKKAG